MMRPWLVGICIRRFDLLAFLMRALWLRSLVWRLPLACRMIRLQDTVLIHRALFRPTLREWSLQTIKDPGARPVEP